MKSKKNVPLVEKAFSYWNPKEATSQIECGILNDTSKDISNDDVEYEIPNSGVYSEDSSHSKNIFNDFINSFKPKQDATTEECIMEDPSSEKEHRVTESKLERSLSSRILFSITIGTGIGTGLLVANGKSLHFGGPAGVVIAYILVSVVVFFVMDAASEVAVAYPTVPGGFNACYSFLFDEGFSFATIWLFLLQWLTVFPLELITVSLVLQYWNTTVDSDIWVLIFYFFIIFVHLCGTRVYGEIEFFCNSCKILLMAGFFIFAIVINCGGGGKDGYIGGRYWHDPGAFRGSTAETHFKGLCYVLVIAYFSFGGIELSTFSVSEHKNPKLTMTKNIKTVMYRIIFIYLVPIILLCFLVPYNSPDLMGSSGSSATHASPFVLAASLHGVRVVPHFINAVILISVTSVSNSAMYAAPRLFYALAELGYAPNFLKFVDRRGRPLLGILTCAIVGLIAFAATSQKKEQVFTWLASIAGLSEVFTWTGICINQIRFRQALKYNGRSVDELAYKTKTGIWGSVYAVFFNILVLIAQFWVAVAPIGENGKCDAEVFFENYLAVPIWIVFYLGYKIYKKDWRLWIPISEVNLTNNMAIYDMEILKQEHLENRDRMRNAGYLTKFRELWC
ncbi:related to Leu/Val/Ile amino-acid permease [Saccharomycodes ludwigii]|uniref:Related to Leu/Val/Ile amino-acid permease n=1 Tax=Saccharomycodes ludwigii TaxID=36035 RepID=A0A376B2W8_9ASCO|nr:related to Leu/Val/Ile amino-acid permease [Saccharomycodes ludwigii]